MAAKTALRENVHFHQADHFHRVHVEMRRGIAFVGNERGRQFVHRLAGKHHAARVHLGIARHAVQKFRHSNAVLKGSSSNGKSRFSGLAASKSTQSCAAAGRVFGRHPAAAKTPRKMVGEFLHFAFRHAQHFGHIRKRAPGLKGRKAAHTAQCSAAVFRKNQIHHVIFAVVRENQCQCPAVCSKPCGLYSESGGNRDRSESGKHRKCRDNNKPVNPPRCRA